MSQKSPPKADPPLAEKKFQKKIEDFVCENCGQKIKGSGFTNHCPNCFYSKHVDINPGDRASDCGGLMKPIALEGTVDKEKIVFRCEKCGLVKKNKLQKNDDKQELLKTVLPLKG